MTSQDSYEPNLRTTGLDKVFGAGLFASEEFTYLENQKLL